eukprot:TRINITY_DN49742_c0_g1_i1.p1 TRINITY_DN49742_c0_g1~~TRINITY_DN49742_c0_g1_i1.p1  ORF type:complete len:620 (-),score=121.16 TRINITY_DN49742_c0_g1_i1:136-1995(-)
MESAAGRRERASRRLSHLYAAELDISEEGAGSSIQKQKSVSLNSFIRSSIRRDTLVFGDSWQSQKKARAVISSVYWDLLFAVVIVLDLTLTAVALDTKALSVPEPVWLSPLEYACFAMYAIDFALWFFVSGLKVFRDRWLLLDLGFLILSTTRICLAMADVPADSLGIVRVLRMMRIIRFVKLLRKFMILKELRKLILMVGTCLKTLIWCFVFCFVVMTFIAMFAVEFASPVARQLEAEGYFEDCERCGRALDTVMSANLHIFRICISGDSWGMLAVPLIERSWPLCLVFIGAQLVIAFGVLNLILAVVVDSFAEERLKDVTAIAEEIEHNTAQDISFLKNLFNDIDTDGDGMLSFSEVVHAAKQDKDFQARLRIADIDKDDLQDLFNMMDEDGGGTIDEEEFYGCLSRWMHESKSASRFTKYNVDNLVQETKSMSYVLQNCVKQIDYLFKEIAQKLSRDLETKAQLLGSDVCGQRSGLTEAKDAKIGRAEFQDSPAGEVLAELQCHDVVRDVFEDLETASRLAQQLSSVTDSALQRQMQMWRQEDSRASKEEETKAKQGKRVKDTEEVPSGEGADEVALQMLNQEVPGDALFEKMGREQGPLEPPKNQEAKSKIMRLL